MLSLTNKEINSEKKKTKVIDDDVHLSNIEKIIVRDFFPDLPKLENQVQFLEALDKNDIHKMSELKSKVIGETPQGYETPQTSAMTPLTNTMSENESYNRVTVSSDSASLSKKEQAKIDKMSLNQYMEKYTSEDNANLIEMIETSRNKIEAAKEGYQQRQLAIGDSSKTKFWKYENKNAVMYTPEGVELSAADKLELSQSKKQTIDLANTRFRGPVFNNNNKQSEFKYPPLHIEGKIGLDGKEILSNSTPNVRGYRFLATPSPAPGVDASPLMTWGEIDSTPFRLDGSSTPGPVFKIPEMNKKEQILHELAGKLGREKKAKKAEALKQAAKTLAGTPRASMSTAERLQSMSPAAQRVASQKLKLSYDNFLNSPRISTPKTPKFATPRRDATPKITPKRKDRSPITDNLLKIPKNNDSNFPKASDFF